MNEKPEQNQLERSTGLKLAEWTTMLFSLVLVLGVAAGLGYEATRENEPFVAAEVSVLHDQAQQRGETFILPIEVRNTGRITLKDLKIVVTYQSAEGQSESSDFIIDYLGGSAKENVYLYLKRRPSELKVSAEPSVYQVD